MWNKFKLILIINQTIHKTIFNNKKKNKIIQKRKIQIIIILIKIFNKTLNRIN